MTFTLTFLLSLATCLIIAGLPITALIVLLVVDVGIIANWSMKERDNGDL